MLRGAASRVGTLALRLRKGAHYFQEDPTYYGGLVNDTTPGFDRETSPHSKRTRCPLGHRDWCTVK